MESSVAFGGEPQGDGSAERFIRTLKKNLFGIRHFDTAHQLRQALLEFRQTPNHTWIIGRLNYQTYAQGRRSVLARQQAAA